MRNSIRCIHKKIAGKCRLYELSTIYHDLEINNHNLNLTKELSKKLEKCIKRNDLSAVLNFDAKEIDDNNVYAIYPDKCDLTANSCDFNIELRKRYCQEIRTESDKLISQYTDDLNLIKYIKSAYKELNESSRKTNNKEYFKFSRDKENNLIAIYFNIDEFINRGSQTVYLLSSKGHYWREKYAVLHLKYDEIPLYEPRWIREKPDYIKNRKKRAYACIGDFNSNDKKKGHGTFILKNLEDIIIEVNKRIDFFNANEEDEYNHKNKIQGINGLVRPGDIPLDILVKFYNKHGYKTYENNNYLYKQI